MTRRALTLTSATALAGALLAGAAPAHAQDFCNTTTGGPFNGTVVCVGTDTLITGYIPVPYSVGSICVASVCTPPASGTIDVPVPDLTPAHAYGTLCVKYYKENTICVPFDSRSIVLPDLS